MRLAALLFIGALCACSEVDDRQALGTLERDRIVLKATANDIITSEPVAEGFTCAQLAGDLLWLLGFTVVMLGIATKRFTEAPD